MHGWLGVIEILGILVLLVAVGLGLLAARQRWLARQGGTFECSLRLQTATPGTGWALGVARYNQGLLEWFRFFSYSPRPRLTLPRSDVRVLGTRDPDVVESVALGTDQRVITVETTTERPAEERELAMSQDSLTGLLSWLEAAPPGAGRTD
ncbi:MAG TPA: DUF2550 domain-containing protein [Propionibacteriaceae bacterium]